VEFSLWNLIEDVRGERGYFVRYPGACDSIDDAASILVKKDYFTAPNDTDEPVNVLMKYLNYTLRSQELGQVFCEDWVAPSTELAERVFGQTAPMCLAVARNVVRRERGKEGTWKAIEAAKAISKILQSAGPTPPPMQSTAPGDGDEGGAGTQDAKEGEGSKDAPEKSKDTDGVGANAGAQEAPRPAEAGGPSASGQSNGPLSPSQIAAAHKAANAKVAEIGNEGKDLGKLLLEKGGFLEVRGNGIDSSKPSEQYLNVGGSAGTLRANEDRSRRTVLDLGLQLEDLLMARGKVDFEMRRRGVFDDRNWVSAVLGRRDVYRVVTESPCLSTRIAVLVDISGSMGSDQEGSRTWITNTTIVGIGSVLDRCDVPFSIGAFNGSMYVVHRFGDNWRQTVSRFGMNGSGGTSIASPYVWAIEQLMPFDEDRKIVLLVSDGAGSDMDQLRVAIRTAQAYGIETRAVLISPKPSETEFFRAAGCNPGTAMDLAQIPKALFETLETVLNER